MGLPLLFDYECNIKIKTGVLYLTVGTNRIFVYLRICVSRSSLQTNYRDLLIMELRSEAIAFRNFVEQALRGDLQYKRHYFWPLLVHFVGR